MNHIANQTQPASGATPLAHWGLIHASGEDAASFLHGQLTQDFKLLDANHARLAGFCSVKGRLQASFIAWRHGDHDILLALPRELLAPTLKRLSMFVMRAKCKLQDASADWQLWGLQGDAAQQWLAAPTLAAAWDKAEAQGGAAIRLPESDAHTSRFLWASPIANAAPALPVLDAAAWALEEVRSAVVPVLAATAEQFVPQMVNYELVGGVNFKKGCYPGQEIVARSQYRGTLKRRGLLFTAQGPAQVGQDIFSADDPDQPAGIVAAAATLGDETWLFASVKLDAAANNALHLGSATGPALTPQALPYPLPAPGESD